MRILVFDNYDSFTYNLVHMIRANTRAKVDVFLNDQMPMEEVGHYDKIVLSPGPGLPEEAGILLPLIREYAAKKSILGVCLGHQAIGQAFGGKLKNLSKPFHGISTTINIINQRAPVLKGLSEKIEVGHYHSWVVSDVDFPSDLEVTARDAEGNIMALQHLSYDLQGVQFHPESVLTPEGERMMVNWLNS